LHDGWGMVFDRRVARGDPRESACAPWREERAVRKASTVNNQKTSLVTGGAGYVGSHVVLALRDAGRPVVVLDDLSTGLASLVPDDVPLVRGDVGDRKLLDGVMRDHDIDCVLHFAGSIVVPESVERPLAYYRNNTANSLTLIEACLAARVRDFVFSSTAAVYGAPAVIPVDEDTPPRPLNPYGESKLMTECMLRDASRAHGLRYAALRYFNVAGADPAGRSGQCFPKATHLIKVACEAAVGRRPYLEIFGTDYDTPDGTCVRDYIHVSDLAELHLRALAHLESGASALVLNCGYGRGHSVREVVAAVSKTAGRPVPTREAPRRPGDSPALVADVGRLRQLFRWHGRYADLDTIVSTALAWERRLGADASP
jgi:UDP-glucose 4-epimerase